MALLHRTSSLILACLSLAFLAGCGSADSERFGVVVIGKPGDPFEGGVRLSAAGQLVRASTREGLVAFDAEGRIVPALADRWIVTDDGLSYIFRLRDGTWRDGEEITGQSARQSLRSAISALEGTAFGIDLRSIEEIRAMAGRVIEIRLKRPMPYFLQLLAQPELGLAHRGSGAGPMQLKREGNFAALTPIDPKKLGLPQVAGWEERIRSIYLSALPGEQAIERFNEGEADLVLDGRIEDFPRATAVGILRGSIQPDAVTGLFGLKVRKAAGLLAEAKNREAIAMAIDRAALVEAFGIDGWQPTTRMISPGIEDDTGMIGERWENQTIEQRRAVAAGRIASWRGQDPGAERAELKAWLPPGPGSDMIFARLRDDLGQIGVTLLRARSASQADLEMVDIVARYPGLAWFFSRMNCRSWPGACEPAADARFGEALSADSPEDRVRKIAEAEELLTEANMFIPFGVPIRWSLVRGDVQGFSINRWSWHPLMPMAVAPK